MRLWPGVRDANGEGYAGRLAEVIVDPQVEVARRRASKGGLRRAYTDRVPAFLSSEPGGRRAAERVACGERIVLAEFQARHLH